MGIGKMKWKIENGKSDFSFFCFRFTIYSEEQIFFIDIHLLFKKHSGENSRNEINWWYGRGELRGTYNIRGQMYEYIFAQSRGYCVSYPSNILQRDWKIVYEQLTLFYGGSFLSECYWVFLWTKKYFPSSVTTKKQKRSLIWEREPEVWKLWNIIRVIFEYPPV